MALELFAANLATTTVSSGGTDAPASGTPETWTVVSSAMFGAAATGVSQFHVADTAANSEIIAVTNVSGTTWTVTRGAESTTPVTHTAGFTVYQVVTTGALNKLYAADWLNVVTQYGADPTGTADSTTAIQNAMNAAGTSGASVYLPAGTYLVSSALTMPAGITLLGDGNGESVIKLKASTSVTEILGITATQYNYSATIRDLQINGNKANSATATHGIYLFAPSDCIVQRVRVVNVSGNAITLDGSGTYLGTATKVLDSYVRTCGGNGLNITQYCTDTLVEGCDFGSCTGKAYYVNGIQAAFAGSIGWGSSEGLVCDSSSGEIWVSGCRFDSNQYYGVWVLCPNFTMTGTLVYDNSAVGTGTEPGMVIDAGAASTVVSGCRFAGGLNGGTQQSYGIQLSSGRSGPATVTGCDVSGNGTGGVDVLGVVTGDRISGTHGYNPQAAQAPSMASDGSPYTNPYPYDCMVWISGGSVSAVSIGATAVPLTYSLGGVRIPAGQTITVTYTGSPTWTWFGD